MTDDEKDFVALRLDAVTAVRGVSEAYEAQSYDEALPQFKRLAYMMMSLGMMKQANEEIDKILTEVKGETEEMDVALQQKLNELLAVDGNRRQSKF